MGRVRYVTYQPSQEAEEKIKGKSVLLIDDATAQEVLDMDDCLKVVEQAYKDYGLGWGTAARAKHYAPTPEGLGWYHLNIMPSALPRMDSMVIRMQSNVNSSTKERVDFYTAAPGKWCELIFLFSIRDGTPLAIMHGGHIQHMRVGATGGISAKYMSREDSSVLGLLGTGGMATTHAWAISQVRPIKLIKVFSPNQKHREDFARQMTEDLGIQVVAQDDPVKVWEGADIVAACTNSRIPVIKSELLRPGMHVSSNLYQEIDDETFRRCDRYVYSRTPTTEHYVGAPKDSWKGIFDDHMNPKKWVTK